MIGSIGASASSLISPYLAGGSTGARAQAAAPSQSSSSTGANGKPLSATDQTQIDKLKARDTDVKAHEQAHRSVGGQFAGVPSYTYQQGPDGKKYAIGGEVSIDTSPVPKDTAATIAKEEQVQRAALAPADPSTQDLKVAAEAANAAAQAEIAKPSTANAPLSGPPLPGQAGPSPDTTSGAGGNTSAAATTATAAAAQSGGGFNPLMTRGIAAYAAGASLASPASRFAVYA